MRKQILTLSVSTLLPALALGQNVADFECSFGELKRRLVIVSEPGVSVPCEVHYFKDNEAPGEHQVLWRATNEQGYCEAQASQFRQKLVGWGWHCNTSHVALPVGASDASAGDATEDSTEEPADESADVDDTDVLIPAELDELGDNN